MQSRTSAKAPGRRLAACAKVERENIPEEPEEGITYRDVKVDWSVAQRIVHPVDDAGEED